MLDLAPSWLSYFDDEHDVGPVSLSAAGEVEWVFHDEQLRAWQSTKRTKVVVAGRRGGKSELSARWMLAGAQDDNLKGISAISWVITPTREMARPLWRKFQALAPRGWITHIGGGERLPDYIKVGRSIIEFKSGDQPQRLVGEGLRRVAIDEAGIIKEAVYKESLLPALMDHKAPALLTGTPKGRNWFGHLYTRGLDPLDPEVATFTWSSGANPFIDPSEIERVRGEMPERLFRQEILAHFLEDEGAVFRAVRAIVGPYSTDQTVAYGLDLARLTDYTVVIGMDKRKRVTFMNRWRKVDWPVQRDRVIEINRHPRNGKRRPKWCVDATGNGGDAFSQDLVRAGLRVDPFVFTAQSKTMLIDALALEIEKAVGGQSDMRLPDEPVLLNELEIFEFTTTKGGNTRYSAPEGLHDDCVCSLALCNRAAHRSGDTGVTIGSPAPPASKAPGEVVLRENPSWSDPDNWR